MRVISQDGTKDFPYDSSSSYVYTVCINGRIYVRMQLFGGYDDSVDVAYYSTEAKAQKAMEMLKEKYENNEFYHHMSTTDIFKENMVLLSNERFKEETSEYFQFPQDEDVEV